MSNILTFGAVAVIFAVIIGVSEILRKKLSKYIPECEESPYQLPLVIEDDEEHNITVESTKETVDSSTTINFISEVE